MLQLLMDYYKITFSKQYNNNNNNNNNNNIICFKQGKCMYGL